MGAVKASLPLLVMSLLALSACPFALPRIDEGEYACASDDDCLADWRCDPAGGVCVKRAAPGDGGLPLDDDGGPAPDGSAFDGGRPDGGAFDGGLPDGGTFDGGPACPAGNDRDGDGRGDGCTFGPDCDDDDPQRWALLVARADEDGDGWYAAEPTLTCTDGRAPEGHILAVPAAFDCDDGDGTRAPWREGYADLDGDGVAVAEATRLCTDGALPPGYREAAPDVPDCDDDDARRRPGASERCDGVDNDCSGFADDSDDVCPCPVTYHLDPLHPYQLCQSAVTWPDAATACAESGYQLVVLERWAENHFLRQKSSEANAAFWIGLFDGNGFDEGAYRWVDTTVPAFLDWRGGEPNNGGLGNEDCVELRPEGWNDEGCGSERRYVCEALPSAPSREPLTGGGPGDVPAPDAGPPSPPDCRDDDGDGWRTPGCDPSPDCDDSDDARFLYLVGFRDRDEDGFTDALPSLFCTDGSLPAGAAAEASPLPDCDDEDPGVADTLAGYPDADGDGAPAGLPEEVVCVDGALPSDYLSAAPDSPDCDDGDPARAPHLLEACNGRDDDCSGGADDVPGLCACPVAHPPGEPLRPYQFCIERTKSWEGARHHCQADGYDLVIVDDGAEDAYLKGEASSRGGAWWIGLSDLGDEGTFSWFDGSPLVYSGFKQGEPSNSGLFGEHCAWLDGAGWNDAECQNGERFICEPR